MAALAVREACHHWHESDHWHRGKNHGASGQGRWGRMPGHAGTVTGAASAARGRRKDAKNRVRGAGGVARPPGRVGRRGAAPWPILSWVQLGASPGPSFSAGRARDLPSGPTSAVPEPWAASLNRSRLPAAFHPEVNRGEPGGQRGRRRFFGGRPNPAHRGEPPPTFSAGPRPPGRPNGPNRRPAHSGSLWRTAPPPPVVVRDGPPGIRRCDQSQVLPKLKRPGSTRSPIPTAARRCAVRAGARRAMHGAARP